MPARPLVYYPDPLLREICVPVDSITDEIRQLASDMFDTMYENDGLGLAAIQIGVLKRVVVLDVGQKTGERVPMVLINPELIWTSEEQSPYREGCLSLPELYEFIDRPHRAKVRYTDLDGKAQEIEGEDLLAKALQHEIDHLNGVLFIDHLSKMKKGMAIKKFTKIMKLASNV